jgi:hypothetical protein
MGVPPSTHGECLHLWTLPKHWYAQGTFTTLMEITMATRMVLVLVVGAAGMRTMVKKQAAPQQTRKPGHGLVVMDA